MASVPKRTRITPLKLSYRAHDLVRLGPTRPLTAYWQRAVHIGTAQSAPSGSSWWSSFYFPNGGVFSVTNEMRDGALVEVATVGIEGMLGIGVFLGDRLGAGRILQQVSDGPFPSMRVSRFVKESATPGPFHDVIALYAQATLLQVMQGTACNALHDVKQRCCRWLLQTQDRVDSREFLLKQEFLAIMLGVQRPTVTLVMGALQDDGLISTRYGRIRVLKRKTLEQTACECYEVIRAHFQRLGL